MPAYDKYLPQGKAKSYEKYLQQTGPGDTAENAIDRQHPELAWGDRTRVMNLAANPEVAARYLKKRGFEAVPAGAFDIRLRKPGGKWYKLDPSSLEFSDISDIGGDIATGVGTAFGASVGAPLAAGAALPTGPGAIAAGLAGGMAGGAAGAAAVESIKQGIAPMFGLETTPGEAAGAIGREAAIGAISVPAGKLVEKGIGLGSKAIKYGAAKLGETPLGQKLGTLGAKAGIALKRPLRREAAKDILGKRTTEAQQALAANRQAIETALPAKQALELARAEEKEAARILAERTVAPAGHLRQSGKELEEAAIQRGERELQIGPEKLAFQGKKAVHTGALASLLEQRAARAREISERALSAESDAAKFLAQARKTTVKQTTTTTQKIPTPLSWDVNVGHPAYSYRADFLREYPIFLVPFRRAYGDASVALIADEIVKAEGSNIRSSISMAFRDKIIHQFERQFGRPAAEKAYKQWAEETAALLLKHPQFMKATDKFEKAALERVVAGQDLPRDRTIMTKVINKVVNQASERPMGQLAIRELETRAQKVRAAANVQATGELLPESQAVKAARLEKLKLQHAGKQWVRPFQESVEQAKMKTKLAERELGPLGETGRMLGTAELKRKAALAKTARARAVHSRLNPKSPYADFGATWLGGRMPGVGTLFGGGIGYGAGGGVGALVGAAAGRAATPLVEKGIRHLLYAAGNAPNTIKSALAPVRRILEKRGEEAAAIATNVLMKNNPELRKWIESLGAE